MLEENILDIDSPLLLGLDFLWNLFTEITQSVDFLLSAGASECGIVKAKPCFMHNHLCRGD